MSSRAEVFHGIVCCVALVGVLFVAPRNDDKVADKIVKEVLRAGFPQ